MIKKIGHFFEEHIEKIILIIVGILCSWLLITRVLLSPNVVEYDGKTYTPITIDAKLYEDAKALDTQRGTPELPEIVIPQNSSYNELFADSQKDISTNFLPLLPPIVPPVTPDYPVR